MSIFTHVSLKMPAGENLLTFDEWEALPLPDKTSAILKKTATFIKYGEIIAIKDILAAMKEAA